ncbi:patatin-like phospholipase [Pseudoduganella flava]|uniref:Patatin-like phospholipase n=1 Tax=Pseudoduganella flava TaxID=871742 RepID=A0A562Q0H7_9BURK|nr:patatin-like phospholipase family protein [Pseudoduganella flava]TWI50179.1 patatin-like phospholipase [Pseudoduganella flava]
MPDYVLPTSDGQRMDIRRKLEHLGIDCSKGLEHGFAQFCRHFDCQATHPWQSLTEQAGNTFSEVFRFELDALAGAIPPATKPADLDKVYREAHDARLTALAFSGGGIRSATFNLGVVQALAELKLLHDFDYLSTVSGGGYIGGWLSKWIHHQHGDVGSVESALTAGHPELAPDNQQQPAAPEPPLTEPRPVQFLRRYSNYLTPRTGMFSVDTWTLICTYLRNTLLNMATLVAWLALLFLVPRVILQCVVPLVDERSGTLGLAAAACFLVAVGCIAFGISRRDPRPWRGVGLQGQLAVVCGVCLPLVAAGVFGSLALSQVAPDINAFWTRGEIPDTWHYAVLLAPGVCYFLAWATGWTVAQILNWRDAGPSSAPGGDGPLLRRLQAVFLMGLTHLICAMVALAVGTLLLIQLIVFASGTTHANAVRVLTFGMPILLGLFGISITLMIGLVGRLYSDASREWWARQAAWTVICAAAWLFLFGCTFYLPPLLDWAWTNYVTTTAITGALTSLLTLLGLKAGSSKSTGSAQPVRSKELVALIAPYAFSVLAIATLTTALQALVAPVASNTPLPVPLGAQPVACPQKDPCKPAPPPAQPLAELLERYTACSSTLRACLAGPRDPSLRGYTVWCPGPPMAAGTLLLCFLGIGLVLSWRVDVNKFSLYMMYRLRLVRAYFGASTPHRAPHPFTGFDAQDDPPLADMLAQQAPGPGAGRLQRPYHLVNAAINLVGGKELAWQQRKAGNFLFSPAFTGFELPRLPGSEGVRPQLRGAYRPTAMYASQESWLRDNDAGVMLGTAVAVSGAAASPNMGYHSSPPLSFLMTLFNLRLGRWSPNPMRHNVWKRPAPRFGLFSIMAELLGLTDATARFLYLSDGGHFENLGIYELVRRRCRLIVAIDASADKGNRFEDLGNAIRKCVTDFNVPIDLDASKIRALEADSKDDTKAGVCFVTGRVRYSQADGPCADGILLYIKPTIIGGENADVLNYSKLHPEFPHQSTADQFFDESQFESYRALGRHATLTALRDIASAAAGLEGKQRVEALCAALYKRAFPATAASPAPPAASPP